MTFKKAFRIFAAVCLTVLLAAVLLSLPASADDDVTPEIPIGAEAIVDVALWSPPNKTEYFVGEELQIEGAQLYVLYNTGRTVYVHVLASWCSEFDNYTDGPVTIYVQYPYGGDPVSFTVAVYRPEVVNIYIDSLPEKLIYYGDEEFDSSGLTVMATRTDGEVADVTNDVLFSGFDSSNPGTGKDIVCTYKTDSGSFTASFKVDILKLEPVRVEIRKRPTRMEYYDGEQFDISGMQVSVVYNDGHEEMIEDMSEVSVEGYDPMRLGDQYVYVNCRGKSTVLLVRTVMSAVHYHTPGEYITDREPTCTEPGVRHTYCLVCGEIIYDDSGAIPALGHTFGEWQVTAEPTGLAEGERVRTCSVCGDTEKEILLKLPSALSCEGGSAEREEGSYFDAGVTLDIKSVNDTLTEEERDAYQKYLTGQGSGIADALSVSFASGETVAAVSGTIVYTVPVPAGEYGRFLIVIGAETVEVIPDAVSGTVSFSSNAASGGEFRAVLIGLPALETEPEQETTGQPDDMTAPETDAESNGESETDPRRKKIGTVIIIAAGVTVAALVTAFALSLRRKR